jgi:ABC-type phosphate transport system permease subunit
MARTNDKVTIARLEERLINLQKDMQEIKVMISTIRGCAEEAETKASKLEGQFSSHIESHKSDLVKLGLFLSVIVIVINIALRLI